MNENDSGKRKRGGWKKDLLAFGFVGLLLVFLLTGTRFQSVDEYYLTHLDDITPESETVTLTIRCDRAVENWDKLAPALQDERYVPQSGVILAETEYVLRPGDTAFDILSRATRHSQIHLDFQGADKNAYNAVYIRGINHLYEFSCGEGSGWNYLVNGAAPAVGCSRYPLADGDKISFVYTCELGGDTRVDAGAGPTRKVT